MGNVKEVNGKLVSICCVCGDPVDRAKAAILENRATREELLTAEVVYHYIDIPEEGFYSWRWYHGACYWLEVEDQQPWATH
jgi:hypothetical protein